MPNIKLIDILNRCDFCSVMIVQPVTSINRYTKFFGVLNTLYNLFKTLRFSFIIYRISVVTRMNLNKWGINFFCSSNLLLLSIYKKRNLDTGLP